MTSFRPNKLKQDKIICSDRYFFPSCGMIRKAIPIMDAPFNSFVPFRDTKVVCLRDHDGASK